MTSYTAPIRDMRFAMDALGLLPALAELPGYTDATPDLRDALLAEAGKLAEDLLAPVNFSGDKQGAVLENGVVRTAEGFKEAYAAYVEGGWNSLAFDPEHGGQGLPWLLGFATSEMWVSANNSWGLCPMLTSGAVELLSAHGSSEQKALYLEKLVSGEWNGTMNLTEPQAGSDVGALHCRAEKEGDHYRIRGQKIFITWGEHDMTDNIVHMVLARTPDAPEGSRGVSLFIVPKFMVNPDGSLGGRNDVFCVSLEDKLGIHACPTCTMSFGDNDGAVGFLIGEENRGLNCMFTMMNNARLGIGLTGLSIAERAYQQARDYAKERVQGAAGQPVTIINHPDVRRMLLTMKATVEAMRGLIYDVVSSLDVTRAHPDSDVRSAARSRVDLLTPVVKAWCTDMGVEVASLGVQVHGGMGYMEETGAVQHWRDSRIAPIYEGTNGIQAIDLVTRKVLRDGGDTVAQYALEIRTVLSALEADSDTVLTSLHTHLSAALDTLETATRWLVTEAGDAPDKALSGATPYLRLFGLTAGGAIMARGALAADDDDLDFHIAKRRTAHFYAENILSQATSLLAPIQNGSESIVAFAEDQF
ncbi:MAG: acyl-CoA dehydrogenase [Alphaproteobacteria bacterium]|jgi:alkylation response protein AidB-like acyl-CoA dehydrogenase